MKLTKTLKENIIRAAAYDLFASALLEQFAVVHAKIVALVQDSFADFDREAVKPYRRYIHWHTEIRIAHIPGEWECHWDGFRKLCNLPQIEKFDLPFEIPHNTEYNAPYLDGKYQKEVMAILRSYMVNYLRAKEAYEEMNTVLLGINTVKQLEELIPELAKYLPRTSAEVVTAIVPVEQINRVRCLFPRVEEAV